MREHRTRDSVGGALRALVWGLTVAFALAVIDIPLDLSRQLQFGALTVTGAWLLARCTARHAIIALALLDVVVSTRYVYWRATQTLAFATPWVAVLGTGLFAAELYAWLVLILRHLQTAWPLERRVQPLCGEPASWPTVDVLIPTYNESLAIVQDTVLAALALDYPAARVRVYLLDDGRRAEFREFAAQTGAIYLTRPDNRHAKAGNLNAALPVTHGELVCIFDADHVPTRAFLQLTVGCFQRDSRLALLQTPHYFYSPDPVQRNLAAARGLPGEGDLFYGSVQRGNDFWNATFFCGSCALIRREALAQIGGFAAATVTEDAHTALRLQKRGWNTAYLAVRLSAGLATERLALHIGQRARWARGMTQILRIESPLWGGRLSLMQRLCYLNAMLHFQFPLPRIVFLTAPLAYLLLGQSVIAASAGMIFAYAGPHLLHTLIGHTRLHGRYRPAFWSEVHETLLAFHLLIPVLGTLWNPARGRFNVTEKGGLVPATYFDHRIVRPQLICAGALLAGIVIGAVQMALPGTLPADRATLALNIAWALSNLIILAGAIAVGRETRQVRASIRRGMGLPATLYCDDGHAFAAETLNVSMGGLALRLTHTATGSLGPGRPTEVELPCAQQTATFPIELVATHGREIRVKFKPMALHVRRDLVRALLARADAWSSTEQTAISRGAIRSFMDICRAGATGAAALLVGSIRSLRRVASLARPPSKQRPSVPGVPLLSTLVLAVLGSMLATGTRAQSFETTGVPAMMDPVDSPAPASVGAAAPIERAQVLSLAQLGVREPVRLLGTEGEAAIAFDLRRDEVVTAARLTLDVAFSPALLPQLSHLSVSLNDQVVESVPLEHTHTDAEPADHRVLQLTLDPALLLTHNVLNLRFIGHYTLGCEDPLHSSLWLIVSPTRSFVQLKLQHIPVSAGLQSWPAALFEGPERGKLSLPFVFGSRPSSGVLTAAALLASYLGTIAPARTLTFPVQLGQLPPGPAVVFLRADETIAGLSPPRPRGPTLSLVANPLDPGSNVLLVLGRDARELASAAATMSLGSLLLKGETAVVGTPLLAPRRPYDAPRWLPTGRRVQLGELVLPAQLEALGLLPGVLPVDFRLAPDLFLWPYHSLPLRLRYRQPSGAWVDDGLSRLDILFQGIYLHSVKLARTAASDDSVQEADVQIPEYALAARNQLGFHYDLHAIRKDVCRSEVPRSVRTLIDPQTTLDLSSAHHWAILPDLRAFVSAGFPFTRLADLSETAVVLEEDPVPAQIEALLELAARLGEATGIAATGLEIVPPRALATIGHKDILLIGTPELAASLPELAARLPLELDASRLGVTVAAPSDSLAAAHLWAMAAAVARRMFTSTPLPLHQVRVPAEEFSGLVSFVSPHADSRVVVAVLAARSEQLPLLVQQLGTPEASSSINGDVAIVAASGFRSFRVGPTLTVGDLPFWLAGGWWLSQHPLVLAVGLLLAVLLLSIPLHAALRRRARRRLEGAP